MAFEMKGPSLYKNSPMKQDKKALLQINGNKKSKFLIIYYIVCLLFSL